MKNVRKGISDFYKGNITNPYPEDTTDHREWQFGFNKAYFKNLERQKEYERKLQQARA
jgi:hypothetical protein